MNICVFCGSRPGNDPAIAARAAELGAALAAADIGLVYGGGSVGVMGAVADAVLAAGGRVIGVIPEFLCTREIAHDALSELVVVEDMHRRKQRMYELSRGFIALPGGFGTFEEVFEATTWSQLGLHADRARKPVVLLDVADYWRALVGFLDASVTAGFVSPASRALIAHTDDVAEALRLCGSG